MTRIKGWTGLQILNRITRTPTPPCYPILISEKLIVKSEKLLQKQIYKTYLTFHF